MQFFKEIMRFQIYLKVQFRVTISLGLRHSLCSLLPCPGVAQPSNVFELLLLRPGTGADYRLCRVCGSVCVCLSANVSPEPHVQHSPNFLYMLPVAVAQSASGNLALRP